MIAIALLIALDTQSYMSAGEFETFEEGQPLSAGMSYLDGGTPYRDFSFVHGLYDEPLRAAAAFALFGPSIGAVRTLQSVNKIITFGFLTWFLIRVFSRNVGFGVFGALCTPPAPAAGDEHSTEQGRHPRAPPGPHRPERHGAVRLPDDADCPGCKNSSTSGCRARDLLVCRRMVRVARSWFHPELHLNAACTCWSRSSAIGALCHVLFFRGSAQARRFLLGCTAGLVFSVVLLAVLIRGAFSDLARLTALLASDAIQLQFSNPYPFTAKRYIVISLMMAFNCFWVARMFSSIGQHRRKPDRRLTQLPAALSRGGKPVAGLRACPRPDRAFRLDSRRITCSPVPIIL